MQPQHTSSSCVAAGGLEPYSAEGVMLACITYLQGEDDGSVPIPVADWIDERDGEAPLGVYGGWCTCCTLYVYGSVRLGA